MTVIAYLYYEFEQNPTSLQFIIYSFPKTAGAFVRHVKQPDLYTDCD
jgi:hypothetical protein